MKFHPPFNKASQFSNVDVARVFFCYLYLILNQNAFKQLVVALIRRRALGLYYSSKIECTANLG